MMSLDRIDPYTPQEVFRTAFSYVEENTVDPEFVAGLKHGINQVCICCKAGSVFPDGSIAGIVERITNSADLKPWTNFYTSGKNEWAAYKCYSCGYQWSWYREKQ